MLRPILIFIAVCVVAIIAGVFLGGLGSTPAVAPEVDGDGAATAEPSEQAPTELEADAPVVEDEPRAQVNASLLIDLLNPQSQEAVERELAYAMEQGLMRFIVPVPLPWNEGETVDLGAITKLIADQPDVNIIADFDLNPPLTWYDANPGVAIALGDETVVPNIHSLAWSTAAAAAMTRLLDQAEADGIRDSIQGYILRGLVDGSWIVPDYGEYDDVDGRAAFGRWLTSRYGAEEDVIAAWETDDLEAMLAQAPFDPPGEDVPIFSDDGDMWARLDWARFQSESVVRTIEDLGRSLKRAAGRSAFIYVPYGFTLELPSVASGHLALERLLASDIDGLVCPLSDRARAMGQSGAYRIPVNSARYALKNVLYVDDTRTGLENGADESWPFESIAEVFERNAAAAMSASLHPVWSDVGGRGALDDERLWKRFGALARVQGALDTRVAALGGQFRRYDVRPEGYAALTVVIDEESFFHTNNSAPVLRLVEQVRRAALESGVSVHFTLMSDVLADRTVSTPVYLFANAFYVNGADRDRLHAIFERDNATAIWLYAPGYHDVTFKAKNVAETVLMDVRDLEEMPEGGSTYALEGRWIARDTTYAFEGMPMPQFTINPSDDISTIAKYADSDQVSVAATSPGGEWTSVFLADPALPTVLLRELLTILEVQPLADPESEGDTYFFANDLIAVHGANDGPRALPLPWQYDVVDDVDSALADAGIIARENVAGWKSVRSIVFNLGAGETRIFRLKPNTATAP